MNQFTPKNINNNPNFVKGDLQVSGDLIVDENFLTQGNATFSNNLSVSGTLLNVPSGFIRGRSEIPPLSITTVPADTDYDVTVNDRVLLISTTIAGDRTITLPDLGSSVFQLTIYATAMNTGKYNLDTTAQGTITIEFATVVKTVLHLGNGLWTLLTTQS